MIDSKPLIKIPRRVMFLFSLGDLSTSMPLAILMFFQMFFLTDIARIPPASAAWIIGISKFYDAINDPLIGIISDRIKSSLGKRRILILLSSLPLGISFCFLWIVPGFSLSGLILYYTLMYILFDTCFTLFHVSYNSLTPDLTKDYDEQSSLHGFRMTFSIAGTLGAIILATVLGWYVKDKLLLYALLGLFLGVFIALPPLVVFKATGNYDTKVLDQSPPPLKTVLSVLKNRPFLMVMGLYLFSWTTASILSAVLVYFANYYLNVPEQANYFVLVAQLSAILFIPLTVTLSRKRDKKTSFILGSSVWLLVLLGISALPREEILLAYVLSALSGFGISTAYVVPWSMIPDILAYDFIKTGLKREGSYYAFASFFQKMGTGFALWVMAVMLSAQGYITPTADTPVPIQPDRAVSAIRLFMGPVPALLILISIFFALLYPINRAAYAETLSLKDTIKQEV